MKHIESGRSFVEVLGVLAVMGLISIGGLYGYTQAMKRHRANELLNEANKRAVMVATELMAGKEPDDVTVEESSTPYGQFTSSLEDIGDKFKMTISGLDEEVCALMEGLAGGPIRRVECVGEETSTFTAELFFNKDLSTTEKASDYNGDKTGGECVAANFYWCESSATCIDSAVDCISSDNCPAGTTVKSAYTGNDALGTGNCVCTSWTENQCGKDYYCKFKTSYYDHNPGDGICTLIEGTQNGDYWVGKGAVSWWSANSMCIGKGMNLISYDTLSKFCIKYSGCDWNALEAVGLTSSYWSSEPDGDFYWVIQSFPDDKGFMNVPPGAMEGSFKFKALCE